MPKPQPYLLAEKKTEIEKELGFPLTWERMDEARSSRISAYYPDKISIEEVTEDQEKRKKLIEWSVNTAKKFKKTLTPRIKRLEL